MQQIRGASFGVMLGAAFLMATSAIGPGFLTQTSVFTAKFGANFAFVILVSIILDIGVQLNIWRVVAVSKMRATEIANALLPGLGHFLSFLIVLGGLAFNIGNIAGCGLGLNVLFGIPIETGAVLSALLSAWLFLSKKAEKAMDRFTQLLGGMMIALTLYVAISSQPPIAEAALRSVVPHVETANQQGFMLAIVTLVGGTVGGYITFAGAHRLLDGGISGEAALPQVTFSSVSGIIVTALMRILLFLAAFGVVSQGRLLDEANPPASVFQLAAGEFGFRMFGIVMWAAAITSVVGSAYTSVTFLRPLSRVVDAHHRITIIAFIAVSTVAFIIVGKPVKVLIMAGAINGIILPVGLTIILIAAYVRRIVGTYRHPLWMALFGYAVALVMGYLCVVTLAVEIRSLLTTVTNH